MVFWGFCKMNINLGDCRGINSPYRNFFLLYMTELRGVWIVNFYKDAHPTWKKRFKLKCTFSLFNVVPQDQSVDYKGLSNLTILPAGHLTMCNGQLTAFALLKHDPINPSCDLWPTGSATYSLEIGSVCYFLVFWNFHVRFIEYVVEIIVKVKSIPSLMVQLWNLFIITSA